MTSEHVWSAEAQTIADRRQARGHRGDAGVASAAAEGAPAGAPAADPLSSTRPPALTGLALSGGGIRSATFSLGVLQELHRTGALRAVDYLSTVSGGGFVGAWWMAWLRRNPTRPFPPNESVTMNRSDSLRATEAEWFADVASAGIDPVHHLRLYTNYLTPRKGALSADTWRAVTVVLRNLLLTWAILLPVLFATVLLADVYYVAFDPTWLGNGVLLWDNPSRLRYWWNPVLLLACCFGATVIAWIEYARSGRLRSFVPWMSISVVVVFAASLFQVARPVGPRVIPALQQWVADWLRFIVQSPTWVSLLPAFAVWLFARRNPRGLTDNEMRSRILGWQIRFAFAACATCVILGVAGGGHELVQFVFFDDRSRNWLGSVVANAGGWVVVLSAVGGAIYTAVQASPSASADATATKRPSRLGRFIFGGTPPLVLAVLLLCTAYASHAFIGHVVFNPVDVTGLFSFGLGILIVTCIAYVWDESGSAAFDDDRRVTARLGAILCGLCLTAAALVSDRAALAASRVGVPLPLFFSAARFELLIGVAAAAIAGAIWTLRKLRSGVDNHVPAWCLAAAFAILGAAVACRALNQREAFIALALLGSVLAWIMTFGWLVDPNKIALHSFYRGRLVRAYLGASNPDRGHALKGITEVDEADDLKLSELVSPQGPYPLINATLNLSGGRDLTATQRSSDRFLLTPLFCGSSRTRYRRTARYMNGEMTVGTAVAISGAAVSPTMGALSPTAALAALMTLLNVRLGFWAPTPNKSAWQQAGASLWPVYALLELTSWTGKLATYCYLTDGGHFDNTGVYSLVERGCRNLLLVDCGADPLPCFEDLGTVIRRCRIDFGTEIEINLDALLKKPPEGRHLLVGQVTYGGAHADALRMSPTDRVGVIVVLKPRVMHDGETADVRQYALQNAQFPQQVTSDQWFDEAQFESYRKLGETSARDLLKPLEAQLEGLRKSTFGCDAVNGLFDEARARCA